MPTPHQEILSLLARADQLVADADKWLSLAPTADQWVTAEYLRELLVEMRARIEELSDK